MNDIHDTDTARGFLLKFMAEHFENAHYHDYIRTRLAGDYAYQLARAIQRVMPVECKCSLRTKLVGDGCAVCNPKLAEELSGQSGVSSVKPQAK